MLSFLLAWCLCALTRSSLKGFCFERGLLTCKNMCFASSLSRLGHRTSKRRNRLKNDKSAFAMSLCQSPFRLTSFALSHLHRRVSVDYTSEAWQDLRSEKARTRAAEVELTRRLEEEVLFRATSTVPLRRPRHEKTPKQNHAKETPKFTAQWRSLDIPRSFLCQGASGPKRPCQFLQLLLNFIIFWRGGVVKVAPISSYKARSSWASISLRGPDSQQTLKIGHWECGSKLRVWLFFLESQSIMKVLAELGLGELRLRCLKDWCMKWTHLLKRAHQKIESDQTSSSDFLLLQDRMG